MPEGPEIRRAADRLEKVLRDRSLDDVQFGLPRLKHHRNSLRGCVVTRIECRGKALLTRFDNGLTLYSHNQLYGRWYVVKRGKLPRTGRSLRVALHTMTHSALLYSASDIELLDAAGLAEHGFLSRVGPDLLDRSLTWRAVSERLASKAFYRRALAGVYLDQAFLAGIGNYLRSEMLFFAGVPPTVRAVDLPLRRRNELARQTLAVAWRAYDSAGVTNPSARVRRLKAQQPAGRGRRESIRFAVFGRDGLPCYDCGDEIVREELAGRRLYYCPTCQQA